MYAFIIKNASIALSTAKLTDRAQRVPTQRLPRAAQASRGARIDWGPASPFGPDDDPARPMTQDSSESDELRPDLWRVRRRAVARARARGDAVRARESERPIALASSRTLYALLEGPYDETLCEWSERPPHRVPGPDAVRRDACGNKTSGAPPPSHRPMLSPDVAHWLISTQAETVCPQCRHWVDLLLAHAQHVRLRKSLVVAARRRPCARRTRSYGIRERELPPRRPRRPTSSNAADARSPKTPSAAPIARRRSRPRSRITELERRSRS